MNFLSHFYFERFANSPERVLGGLLPDLLKNADKDFVLRPNNFEDELSKNPLHVDLLKGWNGHVEVDRLFHNSDYFFHHTHHIKQLIKDDLAGLEIRPSFFAHIALELLLDHLLVKKGAVSIDKFYTNLDKVNRDALNSFLKIIDLSDISKFNLFLDKFISAKYIYEYADINKITHALFNICRRIWDFKAENQIISSISDKLNRYMVEQLSDFQEVYRYIDYEMIDFE